MKRKYVRLTSKYIGLTSKYICPNFYMFCASHKVCVGNPMGG